MSKSLPEPAAPSFTGIGAVPKLPGVPHRAAIRALEKAGFRVVRQGKHVVMTDVGAS